MIVVMTDFTDLLEVADDESRPLSDRRVARALASAINDWPTVDLISLEEFVLELRQEVAAPLSMGNIRSKCNSYSLYRDAWKAESLENLLTAWGTAEMNVLLEDLIKPVTSRM